MPRAREETGHFQRTCAILLLLLSSLLHAAILPPSHAALSTSALATSASGSSRAALQRAARSVAHRLRLEEEIGAATGGDSRGRGVGHRGVAGQEDEEGRDRHRCRADFVEQFFRILSGPVGKEAEAVVAAVLKLLAENDRVDWQALAETGKDPAPEKRSLQKNDRIGPAYGTEMVTEKEDEEEEEEQDENKFGSKHVLQSLDWRFLPSGQSPLGLMLKEQGGASEDRKPGRRFAGDAKRASPKFNPTGWRRKRRSAEPESLLTTPSHSATVLRRLLQHVLDRPAVGYQAWRDPLTFGKSLRGLIAGHATAAEAEWRNRKRNDGEVQVLRRQSPEQLKRKPLEFNPTGW